jgi:hypothetical protein
MATVRGFFQPAGVGADQKVVNFEQILFANGRMLHLIEAMCSSKSGGNLTSISTCEPEPFDEWCAYLQVPLGDPLLARLNEMHPDRRYEDDSRAGRRMAPIASGTR